MINKIKKHIKRKLVKTTVIETYEIDNEIYKIIDYTSPIPFIKDIRSFSFKKDGGMYSHSAIYLNPKHHMQPILQIPQKITTIWGNTYPVKNTLVLGCAGCSIPRFISLHYPESKTIGVELVEDFIKIAKKHFLLEQIENQFELVQGDAIEFVKNYNHDKKQSIVYIDIFAGNKIVPAVLTEEYMTAVYNCTDENGLIIINILGEDIEEIKTFFNNLDLQFSQIFIMRQNKAQFIALSKTQSPEKEKAFKNQLANTDGVTFIKTL